MAATSNQTLAVFATGSNLRYIWKRGTNVLVDSDSASDTNYVITSAQITNSGIYTILITNDIGSVSNSAKVLVVNPPTIVTNLTTNAAAAVGGKYTFKVVVDNATNSALKYAWYYNGNIWPNVRATNSTLLLTNVTLLANQGTYQVVISNVAGIVTSTAYLTVQTKPVITTQPKVSSTITNGTTVTLSVVATGDALKYQWRKALIGKAVTNLVDQTNTTLVLAGATNDAGKYTVVVSNFVGVVTSTVANVYVYNYNGTKWVKYTQSASETVAAAGDYTGLFVAADGLASYDTAGLLTVSVTESGAYSGKLALDGNVIPVSGMFDESGKSVVQFTLANGKLINLSLSADAATDKLTGSVSGDGWTSVLTADKAAFSATTPAPYAGVYGVTIPATLPADGASGYGTAIVNESGAITFVGTTADGKSISQSTTVSKDGFWPFFIIYSDGNEIIGWLQFNNGKPSGVLNWINSTGAGSTASEVVGSSATE
jgi:hypothetical protein